MHHHDVLLRRFRLSHDAPLRGRHQSVRRRAHLQPAHTNHVPVANSLSPQRHGPFLPSLSLSSLLFTSITLYNYRIDHQAKRANLVSSRHRAQLLPDANRRLDQLASQGEVRREANQATKRVI